MSAELGLPGDAVVAAALARGEAISLRGRIRTRGSVGETPWSTKSTIGEDDRRRADAMKYPFRAVLRIESDFGHLEQGTAFLAGPRLLLTAGHCVFHPKLKRYASRISLFDDAGHGFAVRDWDCHELWKKQQSAAADIGFIRLPTALGDALGYLGTAAVGAGPLKGDFAVSGYPLDVPDRRRQYFDIGKVTRQHQMLFGYEMDTGAGQSGAPVFFLAQGAAMAAGVHIQGVGEHGHYNLALRMTPALVERVRGWIAQS